MSIRNLILFISFIATNLYGQHNVSIGILPSVNLHYKINAGWSINATLQSRHSIYDNNSLTSKNWQYDYLLTDGTFLISKIIGTDSKINFGYLYRLNQGNDAQRLIQQLIMLDKIGNYRLAHRLVLDQTFAQNNPFQFRIRYRAGIELPLNGIRLDHNEKYIKISGEVLNQFTFTNYGLEFRLTPSLGWLINKKNKLEFGVDYRLNNLLLNTQQHTFWTTVSWYICL